MQETAQQYTERLLSYSEGDDALKLQAEAPVRLASLLKGRSSDELMRAPAPAKWSVAQIVAHMADAEIAISFRLRQILSTNAIPLQAYDQNAWADALDYAHRDAQQSLAQYRALREANVALLKSVPRKLWDNYGEHAERGRESITHMVKMTAGHDINHLHQIEAIVGKSDATAAD
jgi:uncharacterized damage-inducible protein DinB